MEQSGLVVECLYRVGFSVAKGWFRSSRQQLIQLASALAGACFPLVELEKLPQTVVLGSCLHDYRLIAPEFFHVTLDRDVALAVEALIQAHVPSQLRSSSVVQDGQLCLGISRAFLGQVLFARRFPWKP